MLKIGDFSKLSRLSVRMLRHYDERGLLVPLSTDPFTGYRYYAEEQLAAAAHIAALRAMGFSLAEISALARQPDRDRLMEALAARRAQEAAALCSAAASVCLLPAFGDVDPARKVVCGGLQFLNGQSDRAGGAARRRVDDIEPFQRFVQIHRHTLLHREGADTAHGVAHLVHQFLGADHHGLGVKLRLVARIVHLAVPGNDH